LREQLLIYYSLDKYISKKKEEESEVKEWKDELEALHNVFEKNREYLDKK
jgi:hypothetical protein